MMTMTEDKVLKMFPGKADSNGNKWLPLWMHSMDTAEVMVRLWERWVPDHIKALIGTNEAEQLKMCRFLGLTHDFGKLTPVFAAKLFIQLPELHQRLEAYGLRVDSPKSFLNANCSPHAKAGEALLLRMNCPKGIAAIIGAHHGKPQDYRIDCENDPDVHGENYYSDNASHNTWQLIYEYYFQKALKLAGYSSKEDLPQISQPNQVLLTGILIMADWIASNTEYFPLISLDSSGEADVYPARIEYAWRRLGLPEAWCPMSFIMDEDRFHDVFGFYPNPVQTMVIDAVNEENGGIYILEAQMGVGKTEAALAAAEVLASKSDCDGIFFGLPTQATANGMFPRLIDWARKQNEETQLAIRLAHGMAALNDDYRDIFHGIAYGNEDGEPADRLIVHPWFGGHKQALLANYVIGTVDQLLMASLKQKHVMLRHLGLAGKVVVIDECHAYDAYMNQYLDRTLNWLGAYKIPVIILSATLPEQRRVELIEAYLQNKKPAAEPPEWRKQREYPLLTWTVENEVRQRTIHTADETRTVQLLALQSAYLAECLRKSVDAGGCCGVIVNTVRKAQELSKYLQAEIPSANVLLLHSRFVATDRAEIEKELIKNAGKTSKPEERAGLIVIGTQVLEQSLDIDFDILITQICPMDLLLQRIGRLHRHSRIRPDALKHAICYLIDLDDEIDDGSRAVYGDWLLLRTRDLLPNEVTLPGSIPQLVQETYLQPDVTELDDLRRSAWEKHVNKLAIKREKAEHYRINPPQISNRRPQTIDGWLNTKYPAEGVYGEAAVRDGEASLTVLVMCEHADGRISFLPWQNHGAYVSASHMPDDKTARTIAGQRLNLPIYFSKYGNESRTIQELEELNRQKLAEWQNSGWLSGELVLLLDEHMRAMLCGRVLRYTKNAGLIMERGEEADEQ